MDGLFYAREGSPPGPLFYKKPVSNLASWEQLFCSERVDGGQARDTGEIFRVVGQNRIDPITERGGGQVPIEDIFTLHQWCLIEQSYQ